MIFPFRHKLLIIAVVTFFAFGYLIPSLHAADSQQESTATIIHETGGFSEPTPLSGFNTLYESINRVSITLAVALEKKILTPDGFERLDFSYPSDDKYGTDPGREVFNPGSEFHGYPIAQRIVDRVTTVKGTRVIYNLRRFTTEDGHIIETLYAVVPNMDPKVCELAAAALMPIGNFTVSYPLVIPVDNSQIVTDPPGGYPRGFAGAMCVHDSSGKVVFFDALKYRLGANK